MDAVCKESRKPLIWGQCFLESHSWKTQNLVNTQLPGFCSVCVSVNDLYFVDGNFCVQCFKIIVKIEFFFGWWILSSCLLYDSHSYLSLWCVIWSVSGNASFTVAHRCALRIPWCTMYRTRRICSCLALAQRWFSSFRKKKKLGQSMYNNCQVTQRTGKKEQNNFFSSFVTK